MKATQQTLEVITQKFTAYLKKIKRRPSTIEKYTEVWHRVKVFMQSRRIEFYDKKVGEPLKLPYDGLPTSSSTPHDIQISAFETRRQSNGRQAACKGGSCE